MKNKKLYILALPLLMTACGSFNDQKVTSERPEIMHQIGARPVDKELVLRENDKGELVGNNGSVQSFIMDYERRGHGDIIVYGDDRGSDRAIVILNSYGISTSRIQKKYADNGVVKISFSAFSAVLPECGRFQDEDHIFTFSTPNNKPSMNYGCATQRDLGLMMQDPLDSVRMRGPLNPTDSSITGEERVNAMHQYQAPPKAQAQSGGGQ